MRFRRWICASLGAEREKYELVLREAIIVPECTATVGVLAPIDGGKRPSEVRADAAAEGR